MRVLCVTCTYPPYAGGIGNVAARHARMLADAGHQVAVATPAFGFPPGTSLTDGITVHRLPIVVRHGNSALVRGLAHLLGDADAMYLHYPFYGGAEPAVRACRSRRIPYAVFFHMDVHRAGLAGRLVSLHRRFMQPSILRGARSVLVSSLDYAGASSLAALRGANVIESPYAAPATFAPGPASPQALVRMGIDPGRPVILFVGAMDTDHVFKGIPELLGAFRHLADHSARPMLVLAGEGGQRPAYMRLADDLGSSDVVFTGRVSDADLLHLYRAAYATVLPSTTSDEAYGVVLAEGMACGSPGVASALPGVRTVLRNGETGLLAAPGDEADLAVKIRSLLDDPSLRARMSEAALADRAGRLSPEHEQRVVMGALGIG